MGAADAITHKVNIGLDGSLPTCDCHNFRLKGIPCPEACARRVRLGLDPCKFVRTQLTVKSGLSTIDDSRKGCNIPNVIR